MTDPAPDVHHDRLGLRARKGRPAALLLTAVLLILMVRFDVPPEPGLRNSLFDTYQRIFPRERQGDPVVVVDIDDVSLAQMGQWPWPRNVLADLIGRIAQQHPAAIGIDMLFPEADRWSPRQQARMLVEQGVLPKGTVAEHLSDYDRELAEVLAGANATLGISGIDVAPKGPDTKIPFHPPIVESGGRAADFVPAYTTSIRNIDVLDHAAAGHGLINDRRDRDGVLRRIPALGSIDGTLLPGFALEVLRLAYGEALLHVQVDRFGVRSVGGGAWQIPTDRDATFWLHYSKPVDNPGDPNQRPRVLASSVLRGELAKGVLEGRIVLVGTTSTALQDFVATPVGPLFGVEAHAETIENVFEGRTLIRPWWAPIAEAALLALLAVVGIAAIPARQPIAAIATIGSLVLVVACGVAAFLWKGWLIDVANPAFGASLVFALMLVLTLNAAELQRNTLRLALAATREEQARLEGELDAARRIQTGMLPSPAQVLGGDQRLDLAAIMQPARIVGGDLYDFFRLDGTRLFFMVGDVSGKGLPASLFMALSKALIKGAALRRGDEPGRILSEAAKVIARENPEGMFVSTALGVLDLDTGALTWCSAGHENPYLMRAGETLARRLPGDGGPSLCMVEGFDYPTERERLAPGDTLCLVTDGVTESGNPAGELFGSARLAASLAKAADQAASLRVVERVRRDVAGFADGVEPTDDLTILVLRWKGAPRNSSAR